MNRVISPLAVDGDHPVMGGVDNGVQLPLTHPPRFKPFLLFLDELHHHPADRSADQKGFLSLAGRSRPERSGCSDNWMMTSGMRNQKGFRIRSDRNPPVPRLDKGRCLGITVHHTDHLHPVHLIQGPEQGRSSLVPADNQKTFHPIPPFHHNPPQVHPVPSYHIGSRVADVGKIRYH